MIEDLLKLNKISSEEYQVFQLFEQSELGRAYLNKMIHDTFMEQPPYPAMNMPLDQLLAMLDGRRSVFREIVVTVNRVQTILKEALNDGAK